MNRELTIRQESILRFVEEFAGEHGYPPSLRDICARFNIKSPKNASKHLAAIERKGFIKRPPNISRGISVVRETLMGGDAVSVPIAGRVRAGAPHMAVEDISGRVMLDARFFKCRGAFILKAEGDSMIGAGIEDGDYLLVRPGSGVLNNDIVVAVINDEATVKRFFKEGEAVTLKPENPDMSPIHVKEGQEFRIAGKVVSVIKRFGR